MNKQSIIKFLHSMKREHSSLGDPLYVLGYNDAIKDVIDIVEERL